jgi:putative transposase
VTAKQWLQENGIPNKQYYYWLRRVRRDLYQQTAHAAVMTVPMSPSVQKGSEDIAFAEIPAASFLTEAEGSEAFKPDIIIRTDTAVVAVSNSASKSLLRIVMKAVSHAG